MPAWLLAVVGIAAVPSAAMSQDRPSPHDVTTYPVVYRVPTMAEVVVRPDLVYASGPAGPLHVDLYLPKPPATAAWPVVVFANGVGDGVAGKLKDWEIYRSWARLMAAHGAASVTMEAEPGRTGERIAQVVDYVRREGRGQGLDPDRIALWACSGNVTAALPYAMGESPLRAAVFYYGTATAPRLRTDLPVFYVMAGKDAPFLIEGIRGLWIAAARQNAPWTMIVARDLPHAFDALVESAPSLQLVQDTVGFLVRHLALGEPAPVPSPARAALTHAFGWQWKEAGEDYARMLAQDPGDREARRGYARALRLTGRGQEAIAELRKVIQLGGDGAGVRFELADVLLAEKQFDAAVAENDAAMARGGSAGVAHYNAAKALALAGRQEAALDRLEKAIAAGYATRERIEADQDLVAVRAHPRYERLFERSR